MKPRALVVDDDPVNRRLLSAMLVSGGFAVTSAESAEDALAEFDRFACDVVLLDVEMPDHDGYWTCEQLKKRRADLPVIFISGRDSTEDKVRGFDAGGADYVTKPFRKPEVMARVKAHVKIRELTTRLGEVNRALSERQEELQEELRAAATLQQRLVPATGPLPGLQIATVYRPCGLVGGDVIGVVRIDDRRVAFYTGDVSGHGVASALLTFTVAQALNASSSLLMRDSGAEPSSIIRNLDHELSIGQFEDKYLTMTLLIYDQERSSIRYCTAGHPPPLLLRKDGEVSYLSEGGPMIGLGLRGDFDDGEIAVCPGDRVYLYTDGIVDQECGNGRFGTQRLLRSLRKPVPSIGDAVSLLMADLDDFVGIAKYDDDVALLGVEFS
ncbi:MAG TPA: SpoIIE family protein phosphatase [Thermoanaerobaculia bacterium]|nr:SpoIIE family protein phosphatase [Thermoanaerobaculia bacterium]